MPQAVGSILGAAITAKVTDWPAVEGFSDEPSRRRPGCNPSRATMPATVLAAYPIDCRMYYRGERAEGLPVPRTAKGANSFDGNDRRDFREAAEKSYHTLCSALTDPKNPDYKVYWTQRHAGDTALDFLLLLNESKEAQAFASIALNADKRGNDANWYDDYGWWGLCALRLGSSVPLFGPLAFEFNSIAKSCWNVMRDKAPQVWENAKDIPAWKNYEPRYPGGVWNSDWKSDGCDPAVATLCGFQNTVTNGLFLLLATRMAIRGDPAAAMLAAREYGFLRQWFTADKDPNNPLTDPLLNRYLVGKAAVRERVSAYVKTSKKEVHEYRPTLTWAGDQGLVLGGLVDRLRILKSGTRDYEEVLGVSRDLISGVEYLVPNGGTSKGLLQNWRADDGKGAPGQDTNSYRTGIAACMSNLLYAYKTHEVLQPALQTDWYKVFLRNNAQYVTDHPSPAGDLRAIANDLATLVVSIVILG